MIKILTTTATRLAEAARALESASKQHGWMFAKVSKAQHELDKLRKGLEEKAADVLAA